MTNSLSSIIEKNIRLGKEKFTGRNIRHRRWMLGMTREDLGTRLGVLAEEIEELESGERHITADELSEIAIALEVSEAALANGFESYAYDVDECLAVTQSLKDAFGLLAQVLTTHPTPNKALPRA